MAITKLTSKVERSIETPRTSYVVTLDPVGYVRIREKRVRTQYSISFETLFYFLVRETKAAKPIGVGGALRKKRRG